MVSMMILIFCFSGQTGDESGGLSGGICQFLVEKTEDIFSLHLSEEEKGQWIEKLQFPVRKGAHMGEYALLFSFVLFHFSVWEWGKTRKRKYGYSFLFTVCFAMTDEFHQLFISGRAGQVKDVGIDALGSLIMAIIVWNLGKMLKKRKENKNYSIGGSL